ncbi:S-adenosyl-L-methionine-dependent methyltransferase [Hypoxylon sp. FL0890]|nr:S-adenosyl-L-methionine-dependent methyltransferase [Hypoxylon sp. FL0890]
MATDPEPQPPTQLTSHFKNRGRDGQSSAWAELWDAGQTHFWDRGKPSPALIDWVESRPEVLPSHTGPRLTALVPGCGKGYDVVMLALHAFDAYGLDVSRKGVETAEAYAAAEFLEPSAYNFASEENRLAYSPGNLKFIEGDFFKRDWEKKIGIDDFKGFDLIYDYTFLCALAPEMRKDWALRMSELLSPNGVLACLEFPLYKELTAPGPPWGLKGVHWNLLAAGSDGIIDEESASETGQLQGRFERIAYFKPQRSYESGKGTDMFSVWRLKK